jgi:prefoldin beta subunit
MDQDKLREMQIIDQNLHNIMLQKQAFQMEAQETKTALKEIKESKNDIYKIIGNLMLKTEKEKIQKELEDKDKLLELRITSFEKQEFSFAKQLEKIREELLKSKKK